MRKFVRSCLRRLIKAHTVMFLLRFVSFFSKNRSDITTFPVGFFFHYDGFSLIADREVLVARVGNLASGFTRVNRYFPVDMRPCRTRTTCALAPERDALPPHPPARAPRKTTSSSRFRLTFPAVNRRGPHAGRSPRMAPRPAQSRGPCREFLFFFLPYFSLPQSHTRLHAATRIRLSTADKSTPLGISIGVFCRPTVAWVVPLFCLLRGNSSGLTSSSSS